ALMADQALVNEDELARYLDPAKAAASDFADLLTDEGVRVNGDPRPATATSAATPIAAVESPPVELLVERMLRDSDNQLAEALGRLAALAEDEPASFSGAATAIVDVAKHRRIRVAGIDISDASGLSRDNLVTVDALGRVLQLATADDALRPILTGLPVAGFEGTLVDRYVTPPQNAAAGVARAKTGTLTGVSAEAGSTVSCAGDLLIFAFIADLVVDTLEARDAMDRAVATLSTCP
ncbi:MAG: D-alanyl-D-alanine carboxypeptidase/D-alanyl-D-alanine-endopeptidase, partial [Candidatus Nanopelagicales bacterium]